MIHALAMGTACVASALAAAAPPDVEPAARVGFRVLPYVQNPTSEAITVIWFSDDERPGTIMVCGPGFDRTLASAPRRAQALAYQRDEIRLLPGGVDPGPPFMHRVRVDGLGPDTSYAYRVRQGEATFDCRFRTAPAFDGDIRFIVYADAETEPESTGRPRRWPDARGAQPRRLYPADQTEGYAANLRAIASRRPDFIAIAGDLVESGGEQRDWDEFWRHNAGELGSIASSTPILPAVGNHENYGGPGGFGAFGADAARQAIERFGTYFDVPANGSDSAAHEGRYYRVDYGPVTLITIDSSNGRDDDPQRDTNLQLAGGAGEAPDFNPGSAQHRWLEAQLADAQRCSRFTFVQFHHAPYSVGPHGLPSGAGGARQGENDQSGRPLRVLTPLLLRYGVDAVFTGHEEMYERSVVSGTERLPGGGTRRHRVHFYVVGSAGDGLRGIDLPRWQRLRLHARNPHQAFLAHFDAPERWHEGELVDGGRHYGHVEVNVSRDRHGRWQARIEPVYICPRVDEHGRVVAWERRVYDDVVVLVDAEPALAATPMLLPGLVAALWLVRRGRSGRRRGLRAGAPAITQQSL